MVSNVEPSNSERSEYPYGCSPLELQTGDPSNPITIHCSPFTNYQESAFSGQKRRFAQFHRGKSGGFWGKNGGKRGKSGEKRGRKKKTHTRSPIHHLPFTNYQSPGFGRGKSGYFRVKSACPERTCGERTCPERSRGSRTSRGGRLRRQKMEL